MDAQLYQQEGKKLSSKLRGPLCPTFPYTDLGIAYTMSDLSETDVESDREIIRNSKHSDAPLPIN